jgi:hypothetical protein
MFASVLGMALSIGFGIANTYAIGVAFYGVCAIMIVTSRGAVHVSADDAAAGTIAAAPSIQPTLAESAAGVPASREAATTQM